MRSLLHSVLFRAVCLAVLACAFQALSAQNVMAAEAGQPLVLVLPFQVNAGPDMPNASRDVPQLIASQLEQNGLKAVPMNRARALFERSGDNTIDLAAARRLGRQAGAKLVIYGSFNQLGDGFTMDTRLVPVEKGEAVPAGFERNSLVALSECAAAVAGRASNMLGSAAQAPAPQADNGPGFVPMHSPAAAGGGLTDVQVRGMKIMDPDTVLMRLTIRKGDKPDANGGNGDGDNNANNGEKTYKVAMICDSSINDGGWGAACYNAMVKAAEEKNWQYDVTDSISQDQYYDSIVAYCALGYDMIYAPGNQYTDAVLQAAEEYPDIAFALLNGAEKTPGEAVNGNVGSLLPNAQQIGWIAGALAGLMTESGKLGFIGGFELETTQGKIAGFEEAAKYVGQQEGKTVELLAVPYANSFSDAPKGKEFATELISQGADVFFGDASAVDSGAREAIDAANEKAGAIKVFDIGQPADILGQNPCIIGSQVTDNAAMIKVSMEAVEAGTFGGNTVYGTLENGGLSAGAINTELVPADKVEKYNAYLDQMKAGTFMK